MTARIILHILTKLVEKCNVLPRDIQDLNSRLAVRLNREKNKQVF